VKIGITINLSQSFWSNGLNQNIKFVYSVFRRLGHEVYYITNEKPNRSLRLNHKYMMLSDVVNDQSERFDVIILAGFEAHHKVIHNIKQRKKSCKVFLLQLGNKIMFDLRDLLNPPGGDEVSTKTSEFGKLLDAIWISPHHEFGAEYIKIEYNNENVKVAPYIWEPSFIQSKIKDVQSKGGNPFFKPETVSTIQVFESNQLINKHFLIPFCIAQKFETLFPNELSKVNIYSTQRFRNNDYFVAHMSKFEIIQKKGLTFFNNRWCTLDALSKFGGTIVSHQYDNDLNYAHFEALYMGLPLVHNSKTLMNEGYYYPDFNVGMGAKQLKSAMLNHEKVHDEYMQRGREFVSKYSPYQTSILNQYQLLLENK
jgi:hypothetical protein